MKKIITLFLFYLGLQASSSAFADDHSEGNWIVDIGEGVAHMAHICTLKSDATMNDISKIDKKLAKYYLKIHQGKGVSLTRILTELHNGKFFGSIFTLILFFSSLSLIFLTLSSFIFATNIFKNKKK